MGFFLLFVMLLAPRAPAIPLLSEEKLAELRRKKAKAIEDDDFVLAKKYKEEIDAFRSHFGSRVLRFTLSISAVFVAEPLLFASDIVWIPELRILE